MNKDNEQSDSLSYIRSMETYKYQLKMDHMISGA